MTNGQRRPKKNWLILGILFLGLVAALFLPGPNGLVSVLVKSYRVRRLQRELPRLEARIDSLERVCRYLNDPTGALEAATRLMAPVRADSTVPLPKLR